MQISCHLSFGGTCEAAFRTYHRILGGGSVAMPFAQTFWSPGYGMLVDRFGVPWEINCDNAGQAGS